jgi:aryl-alcohol dehydrogenase-like predicted oxidoreductase
MLGLYLDKTLSPNVHAKLNDESCQTSELIIQRTQEILSRLRMDRLSVLYLHNEALLSSSIGQEIRRGLEAVLDLGLTEKIGVSVYSEEGIFACKDKLPKLSTFQVPENICDRRLIRSQKVLDLSAQGNSFLVRSVFLQGLLLMDPEKLPLELSNSISCIKQLRDFGNNNSISIVELCLAYANSIPWAEAVIVGVASLSHLQEIKGANRQLPLAWESSIPVLPEDILDPRKWKL